MTRLRSFVVGFVFAALGIVLGAQVTKFPAAASPSITCQASVTLTDAQIKALPTTPVEIVAAPGAEKIMIGVGATLITNFTEVYTNLGATSLIQNLTASMTPIRAFTNVLETTSRTVISIGSKSNSNETIGSYASTRAYSFAVNGPWQIYAENSGEAFEPLGDFTGGNAANTLTVSVLYAILNPTTGVYQACP